MLLSLNALGNAPSSNAMPPRRQFLGDVKFFGKSIVEGVHAKNREWTEEEILDIIDEENFGTSSIFCANLDGNLNAGSVNSLSDPIVSYKIYKRKVGDSLYTYLTEVLDGTYVTTYKDYTSKNNQTYEYILSPIDSTGIVEYNNNVYGTHDFFGWFLSDMDNTICYKFDMELNVDDIKRNEDVKIYENYTEMAVLSYGKRKYISSRINTMPYSISIDGESYEVNLDTLETLRDFINDGEPKYLRNTKGEVWKVATKTFSYKYMDKLSEQPYSVSFEFIQVGLGVGE